MHACSGVSKTRQTPLPCAPLGLLHQAGLYSPSPITCSWLLLCLSDSLFCSSLKLPTACAARLVQGAQEMLLCGCFVHEVPEVLQHSSILFTAAIIVHANCWNDLQHSMPASLSLLPAFQLRPRRADMAACLATVLLASAAKSAVVQSDLQVVSTHQKAAHR